MGGVIYAAKCQAGALESFDDSLPLATWLRVHCRSPYQISDSLPQVTEMQHGAANQARVIVTLSNPLILHDKSLTRSVLHQVTLMLDETSSRMCPPLGGQTQNNY